MKRNKNYWSMFTMIMVAMLSAGFVSCGDDDDNDETVVNTSIVGTWRLTFSNV